MMLKPVSGVAGLDFGSFECLDSGIMSSSCRLSTFIDNFLVENIVLWATEVLGSR